MQPVMLVYEPFILTELDHGWSRHQKQGFYMQNWQELIKRLYTVLEVALRLAFDLEYLGDLTP